MSILELKDINYAYNDRKLVLEKINMNFEKGVFYAILGKSGSGKTTLLSLLAGLDETRKGKILYNGEDIRDKGYVNHRKNNISLVFQNYNLIDYMTPLENLKLVNSKADASIFLADKPTGNLDPTTANEIAELLKESAYKHNKCVIVVTHSEGLAKTADITLRLQNKKLVKV